MSVRLDEDVIRLEGDCPVDDAEPLAALLDASPGRPVDVTGCGRLHSAVAQALLHLGPVLQGEAAHPFTRDHLIPALRAARNAQSPARE
ncbi:hypothetical protein LJR164_004598 [Phenylobacterium sp. LjRoot164]|uniref:hypothetical protein n=1 Tax=unclassified Phenylobacterium TaxID=2640670 RepID=UPI003ECCF292